MAPAGALVQFLLPLFGCLVSAAPGKFPDFFITSARDVNMARRWPNVSMPVVSAEEERRVYIPMFPDTAERFIPDQYIQREINYYRQPMAETYMAQSTTAAPATTASYAPPSTETPPAAPSYEPTESAKAPSSYISSPTSTHPPAPSPAPTGYQSPPPTTTTAPPATSPPPSPPVYQPSFQDSLELTPSPPYYKPMSDADAKEAPREAPKPSSPPVRTYGYRPVTESGPESPSSSAPAAEAAAKDDPTPSPIYYKPMPSKEVGQETTTTSTTAAPAEPTKEGYSVQGNAGQQVQTQEPQAKQPPRPHPERFRRQQQQAKVLIKPRKFRKSPKKAVRLFNLF